MILPSRKSSRTCSGFAQQGIAEPAGAGLFVHDQRIARDRHRHLARQRLALVADLDEIPRGAAGLATIQAVGLNT